MDGLYSSLKFSQLKFNTLHWSDKKNKGNTIVETSKYHLKKIQGSRLIELSVKLPLFSLSLQLIPNPEQQFQFSSQG